MLREEATSERKWGWLPALRLILEEKPIPDHYLGPFSESDNIIFQVQRLIEIAISIKENRAEIFGKLDGESHDEIVEDLCRLRKAFLHTEDVLQNTRRDIENIIPSDTLGPEGAAVSNDEPAAG